MKGLEETFQQGDGVFPTTHWSLIHAAQDTGAPAYRAGLDTLIRKYWAPVYFHIRRHWSRHREEAKDLTQAYFLSFLEKDFLRSVSADKGNFRSFVRVSLRHFLANHKRDTHALKRHPREAILSLQAMWEAGEAVDPPASPEGDPEEEFRNDWKRAVLEAALSKLRQRGRDEGKSALVDLFVRYDLERPQGGAMKYEDLARESGLTVYQVTNGLHWARKEFRKLVVQEIEDQVATREDLKEEVKLLLGLSL